MTTETTSGIDEQAPSLDFLKEGGGLTKRELQILKTIAAHGGRNRDVARQLGISAHTMRHHLTHIRSKLGVKAQGVGVAREALLACAKKLEIIPS